MNIKGHRKIASSCPIKNLISKKFLINVLAGIDTISFQYNKTIYGIITPKIIKKFMENFDNGKYPYLEITKHGVTNV